jgi:cytochrome c biogenesis protein CcmG/thiol:disulfide interchange protein DsbE
MTSSSKLKFVLPSILLFALLGLLWHELFYAKPNEIPSPLIGESIPAFSLPSLANPDTKFTQANLHGRVVLLNVWATWCDACTYETPMLMKINTQYHVPIYSIDYKDDPAKAKEWLAKYGNPFIMTGNDHSGDVAIDLGVYGTPETFVITPAGKIIYRHVGSIDQQTWDTVLYPLIKKYDHPSLSSQTERETS